VKDQVAQRWRDDEIGTRLKAKADDLLGKLKAGGSLADVAKNAGVTVETASGLQRGKPVDKLPQTLITAAFQTPKDGSGSAEGDAQTQRYLFRVTGIIDAAFDFASPQGKAIMSTLQSSYSDDLTSEYIARLETQFGVDVNQTAVNQIIGGGTGQ
jgi:peptidyl-prolyl cis-trans isomerase D